MSARPERRRGIAALLAGLALVLGARLAPGLGGPPLYDGVAVAGPYLYLDPGPGQDGGAQGATASVRVIGGQNDLVAVATPESLPQAQILAIPGSLVLPAGAKTISVSITPVEPPGQPTDGVLGSNVYRYALVDQNGAALTARVSEKVSIVLRSADAALLDGVVERWNGSAWTPLKTDPPGVNGSYLSVVTEFGDFAVVKPGAPAASSTPGAPSGSSGVGPAASTSQATPGPSASAGAAGGASAGVVGAALPVVAAVVLAIVIFGALLLMQRRSGPPPPPPSGSQSSPPPSGPPERRGPYRGAHRVDRD